MSRNWLNEHDIFGMFLADSFAKSRFIFIIIIIIKNKVLNQLTAISS